MPLKYVDWPLLNRHWSMARISSDTKIHSILLKVCWNYECVQYLLCAVSHRKVNVTHSHKRAGLLQSLQHMHMVKWWRKFSSNNNHHLCNIRRERSVCEHRFVCDDGVFNTRLKIFVESKWKVLIFCKKQHCIQ